MCDQRLTAREEARPARRTSKTIDGLHHGVFGLNFGICREFASNFANHGSRDSSDTLLYQLSYLGGTLILLGIPRANRMV
jgi:hypothetical protein